MLMHILDASPSLATCLLIICRAHISDIFYSSLLIFLYHKRGTILNHNNGKLENITIRELKGNIALIKIGTKLSNLWATVLNDNI